MNEYVIPISLTAIVTMIGLISSVLSIKNNLKKIVDDQKKNSIDEFKMKTSVEKITDIDERLTNIENISNYRSIQMQALLSDRIVILNSLHTILENMKKNGSNGNTEKRINELNSHLITSFMDLFDENIKENDKK